MKNEERISPVHADYFKRMLNIKELPDFLVERYFRIKKLLDRIDGHLSVADLANIVLDCGFDPETMNFLPRAIPATPVETITGTLAAEQIDITPITGEEVTMSKDEKIETPPTPAVVNQVKVFLVGDEVNVLRDDDIVSGKIQTIFKKGDKDYYVVELDNTDIVIVTEKDIELSGK